jgi:predicted GNAT family N-acyltransferase
MHLIAADTDELQAKAFGIIMNVFNVEDGIPESNLRKDEAKRLPCLLVGENGEFIGTAGYRLTSRGYRIERVALLKQYRGNGTGTFLVAQMVKKVKMLSEAGEGMAKNDPFVIAYSMAYEFWQKMGFEFDGEEFHMNGYPHRYMVWKEATSPVS